MTIVVPPSGNVNGFAFRLQPNDKLKECLCQIAQIVFARMPKDECSSLFVMTTVGSLKDVTLRLAGASKTSNGGEKTTTNPIKKWQNERFEIVSLVGTFSRDGSCHLHLSMSDTNGATFGGHLMDGVVFTTCEVVLGCIHGVDFPRALDDRTGYMELLPRQILKNERWFSRWNLSSASLWIAIGYTLHLVLSKSNPSGKK
jgi:Predicted DNA-binding protein with PD1-like DNA-binding motif